MNRYDWLIWAFRIVVSGDAINEARILISKLESASGDGAKKREIVEDILLPGISTGSIYIARALIELLLGSIRSNAMIKAQSIYCESCIRIRRILNEAPWANYDLIVSVILCGIGVYLFANPDMFSHYNKVYATLDRFGSPAAWGSVFVAAGIASFVIVAWPKRPPFVLRLLARMGSAFCLLSFAMNNWGNVPPPVSTVTYSVLAAAAVWAVLRTRHD